MDFNGKLLNFSRGKCDSAIFPQRGMKPIKMARNQLSERTIFAQNKRGEKRKKREKEKERKNERKREREKERDLKTQ